MLKPHNRAEVKFDLVREIGHEGRNSTVYVVHDIQLDSEIVMKRIKKANFANQMNFLTRLEPFMRLRTKTWCQFSMLVKTTTMFFWRSHIFKRVR